MKILKKCRAFGLAACLLAFALPSAVFAVDAKDAYKEPLNEKNKTSVNYYKEDSVDVIAYDTKRVQIQTVQEDRSLVEEKTKAFEEKMKADQIAFIEEGLKDAKTLADVENVKKEAAALLKEEKDAFKIESEQYIKEVTQTETLNLVLLSATYKTERDQFFTFNKHQFAYYDVDKKEFVPNEKVNTLEAVKAFEKKHKADVETKSNHMNSLIMFVFLFLMCTLPLMKSKKQKMQA